MEKLTEVLGMGGYAAFVWPAYAAALVTMLGIALLSFRALRRAQAVLQELQTLNDADEA